MAPLQKRAWLGLGVGVVISAAILAVLIIKGGTSFHEDDAMRLLVMGLGVALLVAWAVILAPVCFAPGRGRAVRDERDEIIVRRALWVQLLAVILVVTAWMIALTEVYWDEQQVPIAFPSLIFWSVIIVNVLAQAGGILLGYWRMGRYAEG